MRAAAEDALSREAQIGTRVAELRARVLDAAAGPRPTALGLGASEIPIEAWEWDALVAWANRPSGSDPKDWQELVADGLALQGKTLDDLGIFARVAHGADVERRAAMSTLFRDAVSAYRVLREIQRRIEQLIVKGRIDQAKRLTQFRRRLNDAATAVGRIVGEPTLKEAEEAADASPWSVVTEGTTPRPKPVASEPATPPATDPGRDPASDAAPGPAKDDDRLHSLIALEEELRRTETHAPPATAPGEPSASTLEALGVLPETTRRVPTRMVLGAILALSSVIWLLLLVRGRVEHGKPAAALTLGDFEAITAVTEIVARPPSLYVTVDTARWNRMSPRERQGIVEQIGAKLVEAGYAGAHVTDSSGHSVARWLKSGGVRIAETPTGPS